LTLYAPRFIIQQLNIENLSRASINGNRDLTILEQIEKDPDTSQANLANQLGVAVGTVNWHLKRLIEKGYVKVRRIKRRKLRYIITPEGLSLRAKLLINYIHSSFDLYRLVRERSLKAIDEIKSQGYPSIQFIGEGEVAEVCRLTCLEQGVKITEDNNAPIFKINGLKIFIIQEDQKVNNG